MSAKEFVISHYSKARKERHVRNDKKPYYLIRIGRESMYFSEGKTEGAAWEAAKQRIIEKLKFSKIENLFPSLPKKEWDRIIAAGRKRLSPLWQRHLFGYTHWCELRELSRGIQMGSIKYDKENPVEP